MFSTAIQEASLLSQELEAFAPNLHVDDYQQDRSFLATARALLPEETKFPPRIWREKWRTPRPQNILF